MNEVIYNVAGMRLPIVLTCANRGVSAPITIWNDHQDAMSVRDAGWIMLFAENHQESVMQHILAYKLAESLKLPVMVNIDGFILTHSYEPVLIPSEKDIKTFLPDYKPTTGQFLDTANPVSLGTFAAPTYYFEIREELQNDLIASTKTIDQEYKKFKKILPQYFLKEKNVKMDNGLLEYYGEKNASTILIALGSVCGTIKDTIDGFNKTAPKSKKVALIKIKSYRPFPEEQLLNAIKGAKNIAVIEKALSLGSNYGPLTLDVKSAVQGKLKTNIQNFIVGLGGRDITKQMIKNIITTAQKGDGKTIFVGK
jgi:pyruvate ferredoxin oxidoreductase alpha subunit